jgi:hypothetical protein
VAADAAGNLVIADMSNDRIRVVAASTGTFYGKAMTAGDIFSGDGSLATSGELNFPESVASAAQGNLVIADSVNGRVRMVTG